MCATKCQCPGGHEHFTKTATCVQRKWLMNPHTSMTAHVQPSSPSMLKRSKTTPYRQRWCRNHCASHLLPVRCGWCKRFATNCGRSIQVAGRWVDVQTCVNAVNQSSYVGWRAVNRKRGHNTRVGISQKKAPVSCLTSVPINRHEPN